MTDKEKLQRLFDAALKDSSELNQPPTRLFPASQIAAPVAPAPVAVTPLVVSPVAPVVVQGPEEPVANTGLSDAASAELGALLDEQQQRKSRKRRRELMVTLGVSLALLGSGCGWFVQNPERIQALTDALREIRSVGDVASMVAKYQAALDRVAVRSSQIDQATEAMGVSANQDNAQDPTMEAEMLAMMGGEGKTSGQRNKLVQENFGHMGKKQGVETKESAVKMDGTNSFDWQR